MSKLASLRIVPGINVSYQDKIYQVQNLVNTNDVILKDENDRLFTANSSEISYINPNQNPQDISQIPPQKWDEALSIYNSIAPLIQLGKSRKRADVQKVADKVGKNIATVYRWIEAYEASGLLSSLIRKSRKDIGTKRLLPDVEKIISDTIESFYLTKQKRTPTKTANEIQKICKQKKLPPPDTNTVIKRIQEFSDEYVLRRREGSKAADEKYLPLLGSFPGADYPLAVVQIDHTPVDVIIVDDVNRKSIKRPYLTIATDLDSEMTVGLYLSLDPPGALATGLCLSRAILPKEEYLKSLGLEDLSWPCWGVMTKIHTDNAKEFKGTLLGRAVEQYGIIAERRPKGNPRYGGDVERMFRTFMHEVHNELPGTTFSNIKEKLNYDSEGRAVMTLDALEKWLVLFILGVFHQKPHSGNNGIPPIVKWDRGIHGYEGKKGTGIPMRIQDESRLKLDFMPYFMATIQEYGIRFASFTFWHDALRKLIHSRDPNERNKKQKFLCRYDNRKFNKIWMWDPATESYLEIPTRDPSRPAVSLWEVKEAKRRMRAESKAATNEELIFQTIDRMRKIVKEESAKKKSARVKQQRLKQWESAHQVNLNNEIKKPKTSSTVEVESINFKPFEGIRES